MHILSPTVELRIQAVFHELLAAQNEGQRSSLVFLSISNVSSTTQFLLDEKHLLVGLHVCVIRMKLNANTMTSLVWHVKREQHNEQGLALKPT